MGSCPEGMKAAQGGGCEDAGAGNTNWGGSSGGYRRGGRTTPVRYQAGGATRQNCKQYTGKYDCQGGGCTWNVQTLMCH